jgi:exopolysaccharide production protein ExoZ
LTYYEHRPDSFRSHKKRPTAKNKRVQMKINRKDDITAIQILRGIAALLVVTGHAFTEAAQVREDLVIPKFDFGIGVDIFFLISGFVMTLSASRFATESSPATQFMLRRIIRIVPLYWFYTTGMLLAIALLPGALNNSATDLPTVISSFLFFPHKNISGSFNPVLSLGWTLNYEMYFYVIFALALSLGGLKYWFSALWGSLLLSVFAKYSAVGIFDFWGDNIILEFLVGATVAKFYKNFHINKSKIYFLLGVQTAGIVYFTISPNNSERIFALGLPSLMFFFAVVFLMPEIWLKFTTPASKYIGDSSYSLYLSHPFTLGITKIVWSKVSPSHELHYLYIALSILACLYIGRISYLLIESPITKKLNSLMIKTI